MAIMESTHSISSRESLYSVESEEEDEEPCGGEVEVFPLDSESDVEKEAAPLRLPQDACPDRRNCFTPRAGRSDPHLLFRGRKCHARKPLGVLSPARLQPVDSCCRYPEMLCDRLRDTKSSFPRQTGAQKRTENAGRKRPSNVLGGGQPHLYAAQPPLHGKKRQRNKAMEGQEATRASCWTAGDQIFAQKCWELQGFVRPMMELLYRLKTGRFDQGLTLVCQFIRPAPPSSLPEAEVKRACTGAFCFRKRRALSSFQQSVAMDRIQRIIGVLQKPEMGERYLGTLLQVERMLKVWFPRVTMKHSHDTDAAGAAEDAQEVAKKSQKAATPERSAVPDSVGSPPTEQLHRTHLTDPASSDSKATPPSEETGCFQGNWPAMNMTWIHTAPISNPPFGHMDFSQANPAFGPALLGPGAGGACGVIVFLQNNPAVPGGSSQGVPLASCHASQACCHSSSTGWASGEHPRCQSLPSTAARGSHLPKGALGGLSRSLPNLPTSLVELQGPKATNGSLPYFCNS